MENYRITDPDDLGVRVIKFPALEAFDDALCHAYSTRFGGVSEGIYASMNLGFNRARLTFGRTFSRLRNRLD